MTNQQREALMVLTKLCSCIGFYEGVIKGTYYNDPDTLAKIELKQNETGKLMLELQNMILEKWDD